VTAGCPAHGRSTRRRHPHWRCVQVVARLVCVIFGAGSASAIGSQATATGALRGGVTDDQGRPVAGAMVAIAGIRNRLTTDSTGSFRLDRIPVGMHGVTITAIGFVPRDTTIQIRPSETTVLHVPLQFRSTVLDAVVVRGEAEPGSVRPADDLTQSLILAGLKSEHLQLARMDANLSEKTARQIFARIPGVFVYDMDGTGNQVNISTRGLDAHRSWEMNVRQDGVLVNADLYGYPAAHYSPPMEAMERLEITRGTAALQYGSQFGGLVNYVTKSPDTTRSLSFESSSTIGSFGLRSTFNSLGGRQGPVVWHGYVSARRSDGYRAYSRSESLAQFLSLRLQASPSLALRAQFGRSVYLYRLPGPLTDAMFAANPRQATRSRNYFSPDIVVPSLLAEWKLNDDTRVSAQLSAVLGDRSSVQFIGFADVPDTANGQTGEFAPRQVDIDGFRSITGEIRMLHQYRLFARSVALAMGLAVSDNDLHRRQQGRGTRGSDYDLTLASGAFGRDIHYRTRNVAWYAENMLRLTPQWSLIPGLRVESGVTHMTGTLSYLDPSNVPTSVEHRFPLFGLRTEYQLAAAAELYGGWSQSYRPMILKDVLPESAIERTEPNLKDAKGWTVDVGTRGTFGRLRYDVSAFALRYNNRFGALLRTDSAGQPYLFKTNVGSSLTRGVELGAEATIVALGAFALQASTATSFFDARYREGTVVVNGVNSSIVGNRVESVPKWISRTGVTARLRRASASLLLSYTGSSFSDPQDTRTPTPNGARGLTPGYTVADASISYEPAAWLRVRVGMSNVFDRQYFTKRPTFYPGPGVWPSDGRGVQFTVDMRR
jgi:Fe(3+) dicitrate transport protein